jgi:hypothetical protein
LPLSIVIPPLLPPPPAWEVCSWTDPEFEVLASPDEIMTFEPAFGDPEIELPPLINISPPRREPKPAVIKMEPPSASPAPEDSFNKPPAPIVELPPLTLVEPPNPALLFPPLIFTEPPAMLDKADPARIPTEPPMPSVVEEELPTDMIMSPPWPLLPPPGPDVKEILPETPDVEAPVDIISCPETPETPASGVFNEKRPELASSLLPLEIRNSPPYPTMLPPADKKLLPPLTVPIPDVSEIVPLSPCIDDPA